MMMKLPRTATIILVISLIWGSSLLADQTTDKLRSLLDEGIACYNAEKYWDAQNIFKIINSIPKDENPYLTTSALMLIKTTYRLGEAEKSIALAYDFLQNYPESKYVKEVKLTLAEVQLSLGNYQESLRIYLDLLKNYPDLEIQSQCEDHLNKIIDFYLEAETVKSLRDSTSDNFSRQYLTIKLAEKYHSEGHTDLAEAELKRLPARLENKYLRDQLQKVEVQLKKPSVVRKYIGVILPLSGSNSASGREILNGVKYAIANYRKNNSEDIIALVFDNRSDGVLSIKQAEFLARSPKVLAIFGPLMTENAVLVAVIANQYQIPMITPTASGSQLASLGTYVFQANVDYENLGRFLGMYGAKVKDIKTVATIAPADEFGKEFTDAFCRTIDEFGGQVISQQWYQGEPTDLQYQINNLKMTAIEHATNHFEARFNLAKKQLVKLVSTDSLYLNDSLRIVVGDKYCFVFKPDTTYRLSIQDALIMTGLMKSTDFEPLDPDTITFPQGLVDGLLIPARANDARLIVPQLIYYDIRIPIFGSANWNEPELLRKNQAVLQNLYFISDYYIETESDNYRRMAKDFKKNFGKEPERMELYGYDTMNALLTVIKSGASTRESVRQGLLAMPVYHGLCRNISFQGNRPRINSCAFLLGFKQNKIQPVAIIENGAIIEEKTKP